MTNLDILVSCLGALAIYDSIKAIIKLFVILFGETK
jgi:hypothetical protein